MPSSVDGVRDRVLGTGEGDSAVYLVSLTYDEPVIDLCDILGLLLFVLVRLGDDIGESHIKLGDDELEDKEFFLNLGFGSP